MSETTTEIKHITYAESWYRTWCPYCEKDNWHCNGNESDLSGLDVEAVKCRICNEVYQLGEPDSILDEIRGNDYDLITEDGRKMIEKPQENKKGEV